MVFVLAAVTIITLTGSPEESYYPTHSTFYTDRFGTHALYRLVEDLEFSTEKNFIELDEVEDFGFNNYIFLGPRDYFDEEEVDSLLSYIDQGAYALCVPHRDRNFLDRAGIELKRSDDETRYFRGKLEATPATIDPLFNPPIEIKYSRKENPDSYLNRKMNDGYAYYLTSDSVPLMPLLERNGEVHAGYADWGRGRIFLLSNPYLFLNEGLKEADNATFAIGLIQRIQNEHPGTFIFDEYHHGFRQKPVSSPFNIAEVRWMTWALLGSFGLLIFSLAKRSALPVPVYREPRRTIQEFISSIAHLYLKRDAEHFVFQDITERFLRRIRLGLGYTRKDYYNDLDEVMNRAESRWGEVAAKELGWILEKIRNAEHVGKSFTYFGVVNRMRKFSIKYKLD